MTAVLLILLSILTLQTRGTSAAQDPAEKSGRNEPAPFTLAALRRDGIVSPFAVFDGKRWSVPWPTDLAADQRRVKTGIPVQWWGKTGPLTEMVAWVDGINRGVVHLTRPVLLRVMCEWRLGLASDYQSEQSLPPQPVQPYPKDGLAVSGTQQVDAIEIVSAQSPEWTPTAAYIKEEFDLAEQEAIRHYTDWRNPIPLSVRRNTPVELEAMYRAPMDQEGWTAYYVEGVKRYAPGPDDDGCGLVASASGWMMVGPKGKRSVKLHGDVTYCDRRGVTFMLPLGLIKAQGKSYWAFQISGYGREGYMVVRPTPNRAETVTHYSAAFCPLS
jgi:hypothetical protein